jgi:YggT family protein
MLCASNPFFTLLCIVIQVYTVILLAWVILSWIQFAGWRPPVSGIGRSAYELLEDVVRPVVVPLRRIIPPAGAIDISVVVAFVILFVLGQVFCH